MSQPQSLSELFNLYKLLLSIHARDVPEGFPGTPDEFRQQLALAVLTALEVGDVIEQAEAITAESAADLYGSRLRALQAKASGHPCAKT
jgi:hypothetical protein